MDLLKATIVISSTCSVVITGASVYAAWQSQKLNKIIAEGTAKIDEWNQYKSRTPLAQ